ncbi:MAG TPA: allantoinase AllB [Pyrinomonadaceae bacterium]|nr:allantoinase AllB [Pyrinomonadaceae bacterium]
MDADLVIRGRCVVLPNEVAPAAIHIRDGLITNVGPFDDPSGDSDVLDVVSSAVVMPGLVDTHVHVNEPGRTEWEGFYTATRAAAAGGTTTLIDMPLNSIPATTTVAALETKMEAADHKCHIDVGFWGGVVPGNTRELELMLNRGVVGFKCFLVPSGVEEFQHVTEADLRQAMPELTRLGALLIVHAELPHDSDEAAQNDPRSYNTFLSSRPCADEDKAIELMIRLSREFGTRVHIVHLSSAEALPMLRDARASGVKISAETCPHYLHFASENIETAHTEFKCCPPIRERENRERLWRGLANGTIETIVSDHSPCPAEMKLREQGDFMQAWGGISSLQLRLPIVWTEAKSRGLSLLDLHKWLCYEPARLVNLHHQKGSIAEGKAADLIVWDPESEFTVSPAILQHRHKLTPYQGEKLRGIVLKTFLRGQKIYDSGEFYFDAPGKLLLQPRRAA